MRQCLTDNNVPSRGVVAGESQLPRTSLLVLEMFLASPLRRTPKRATLAQAMAAAAGSKSVWFVDQDECGDPRVVAFTPNS